MRKLILGNLKMNMTKEQLLPYLKQLKKEAKKCVNGVGVAIPFPYLNLAHKYLNKTNIRYGAQNVHYKTNGAYTGEVSYDMLKDFDLDFCIVGHSERRGYYNENNKEINLKIKSLLDCDIAPVLCFGEKLEERQGKKQEKVVKKQLDEALDGLESDDISKIILAYEPVWAIGTGVSATSEEADEMAVFVKDYLCEKYKLGRDKVCFLYGGSMNDKNAHDLLSKKDIDGGLIGGACLKVETFKNIFNYQNN